MSVENPHELSSVVYNYFRTYDPSTGRYLESDPIGLNGGLNTYWYANQNPLYYYDPDGRLALPIITAIIGSAAGGLGSIISQGLQNGFGCINWKNVAVATGTGIVAGAIAPFAASTYSGAAALGATANTGQYVATQAINGDSVSTTGLAISVATGVAGGVIAGPVSRSSGLRFNEYSQCMPRELARRGNQAADAAVNTAAGNLARSAGAGIASNVDAGNGCECE